MKKFLLVFMLVTIFATSTAFADHPDGFGIGFVGSWGWGSYGGGSGGLSLKIPKVPIYWAINLWGGSGYFRLALTGDYYIIDKSFAPMFHWFLGIGGYFNMWTWKYNYNVYSSSRTDLAFGVRVPIGISFQPINWFELFFDVAPGLGFHWHGKYDDNLGGVKHERKGTAGLNWSVPLELGFRFWF